MVDAPRKNVDLVNIIAERIQASPLGDFIKEEDLVDVARDALQQVLRKKSSNHGYYTILEEQVMHKLKSRFDELLLEQIKEQDETLREMMQGQLANRIGEITVERVAQVMLDTLLKSSLDALRVNMEIQVRNILARGF